MKFTYLKTTVILSLLFFQFSCKMQKIVTKEITDIYELETKIEKVVAKNIPPGISIIVVNKDSVLYEKSFGYADVPYQKKANNETAYHWWSLTKPFTATALLQLQERNLLSINDPVEKYLPYFTVKGSEKNITIKQLLTHSSGLGDIGMKILGWIHYEGDDHFDQTELVKTELPKHNKLKADPDAKGLYSNLGYMVLAAIIEKVSQQSYEDYITEHILRPLEMHSTGFDYTGINKENIAAGSHPKDFMSLLAFTMIDKKRAIRQKEDGIFWFNPIFSNQQGSTGLIGSTDNLSHFMIAILNGGKWNGNEILSNESIELMLRPYIKVDKSPAPSLEGLKFGLSWFIHMDENQKLAYSHGGAGAAFAVHMRLYPSEELGIAVLSNSTYVGKDLGYSIVNTIANIYLKK